MNKEDQKLLELDILGRLRYGVKGVLIHDLSDEFEDEDFDLSIFKEGVIWEYAGFSSIMIPLGDGDFTGFLIKRDKGVYTCVGNSIKPLLHPIECLTKLITVEGYNDGKEFIPIEELLKKAYPEWIKEHSDDRYSKITIEQNPSIYKACFSLMATKDIKLHINSMENEPQWTIDLLNQWHIDWRGLIPKGLAVAITA